MPEKEEPGSEGEEELVGHLRRKPEGLIRRRLPDETAHDAAHKSQEFHRCAKVYFAIEGLPLNSRPIRSPNEWRKKFSS